MGITDRVRGRLGDLLPHRIQGGPGMGLRIARRQASADYRLGTNELPVQVAIADSVTPGGVFLDVGANAGFFSLLAARIVGPSGAVHAIEPVPANAARIRSNARINRVDNVEVHELAASDTNGTTKLFVAAHPGGAAVASAGAPPDVIGEIEVRTARIDDLVDAGSLRPPDVVKIDVEGAEAAVLTGMARTLEDHRPIVICEIDGADRSGLMMKRADICGLLIAAGYVIENLAPSYSQSEWLVEHVVARPGNRT